MGCSFVVILDPLPTCSLPVVLVDENDRCPAAFASATPEDHLRYFATFVGALLTSFERYLRSVGPDRRPDRLLYEQIPLWLTDDELIEATARWTEILERLRGHQRDGVRRRTLVSLTLFPDVATNLADGRGSPSP